jgi:hypothetical protein
LSTSTWTVSDDLNGGADIVDPPGSGGAPAGPAVGPAPHMAVVPTAPTVPTPILADSSGSHAFVFNFNDGGHGTAADFHPAADAAPYGSALFANPQSAWNATQDDAHGNAVITPDVHDAMSWMLKAQLHASDFHFV